MDYNFPVKYIDKLKALNITEPTEIQKEAFTPITEGEDCVFVSQTGSGKTLAYLLPILDKIDPSIKSPQAIIITPTQELSHQVHKVCESIEKDSSALIIGGANINRQIESLKKKPKIIIGSCGRILEIKNLKKLSAHYVKTIVIDEADRMLDDTNFSQLEQVVKLTQKDRQLLFFSATMENDAVEKAESISKNLKVIKINKKNAIPESISHYMFVCEERDKIEILRKVFHGEKINRGLVFINNQEDMENLAKRLNFHQIRAFCLHSNLKKMERHEMLRTFKNSSSVLLLTTDIASRGLDISELSHVINFEICENPLIYLHRAGRIGRMGKTGSVVNIATSSEIRHLTKIEKKFNIKINKANMKQGNVTVKGMQTKD